MKVMLVEDEPLIAMDLETILGRLGHEVVGVAETRAEALSLARTSQAKAALVDVKLRDGFTGPLIARTLIDEFGLRCAFVTGNPEQIGPTDIAIVPKPFTAADIENAIPAS